VKRVKKVAMYFIEALACHIIFLYFTVANKCANFRACYSSAVVHSPARPSLGSVWSLLAVMFLPFEACRRGRWVIDFKVRMIAHWLHLICVELDLWNLLFGICLSEPLNSLRAGPDRVAAVHYWSQYYRWQQKTSIAAFDFCFLGNPVRIPGFIKLIWFYMDYFCWVHGCRRPIAASQPTFHMLAVNVSASLLLVLSYFSLQLSLVDWQFASACSTIC